MIKKNLFWIYSLIVIGFVLILTTSCKKDENDPDYASKIAGTYNGTVTLVGTGTVPCSTTINKNSATKVNLIILIGTITIPFNGISVSSGGNNIYNLSYSDLSGTFEGQIDGDTLTWTLTAGSTIEIFSGTKS
jgi:hypothetical protein